MCICIQWVPKAELLSKWLLRMNMLVFTKVYAICEGKSIFIILHQKEHPFLLSHPKFRLV